MPHLIFRGAGSEIVQKASVDLPGELAQIVGCPQDYFTFFHADGDYFVNGEITTAAPVLQIVWFDRGQIVKNMFAAHLDRFMKTAGHANTDIFFIALQHNDYYENGEHY